MKYKKHLSLGVLMVVLFAAQSMAQITNNYDDSVDFTKYKTFTFKGWSDDSDKQLNDLDKERILSAFEHELNSRSIVQNESDPDMAITLYIVIEDKTITNAYSHYNGNMAYAKSYGYGGYSNTSYSEEDYKEGTLIVNFFDEKEKNLIWEGILVTSVKEKPKKRAKSIPENIRKLMYRYPIKPIKK